MVRQVECIVAADGTPGALEDSYMYLLGTDQSELIAENDDDPSDQVPPMHSHCCCRCRSGAAAASNQGAAR